MGTKNNPGDWDCYANAEPDEPMFILLGRDRDASQAVKMWAFSRMQQIDLGIRPESDRAQVSEAMKCATEMEIWHRERENRRKTEALKFDDKGRPTTGPHAYVEHATTSGANES